MKACGAFERPGHGLVINSVAPLHEVGAYAFFLCLLCSASVGPQRPHSRSLPCFPSFFWFFFGWCFGPVDARQTWFDPGVVAAAYAVVVDSVLGMLMVISVGVSFISEPASVA